MDGIDKPLHKGEERLDTGFLSTSQEDETEQTVPSVEPCQTDDCSTSYTQQPAASIVTG